MDVAERMGLYLSRLNPRTVGHLSEGPKIRARLEQAKEDRFRAFAEKLLDQAFAGSPTIGQQGEGSC